MALEVLSNIKLSLWSFPWLWCLGHPNLLCTELLCRNSSWKILLPGSQIWSPLPSFAPRLTPLNSAPYWITQMTALESVICSGLGREFDCLDKPAQWSLHSTHHVKITEVPQMWMGQCSEKLGRVILQKEENGKKTITYQPLHVIVNMVWGNMFCACWWMVRQGEAHTNEPKIPGPETMCFRGITSIFTYPTAYHWCSQQFASTIIDEVHWSQKGREDLPRFDGPPAKRGTGFSPTILLLMSLFLRKSSATPVSFLWSDDPKEKIHSLQKSKWVLQFTQVYTRSLPQKVTTLAGHVGDAWYCFPLWSVKKVTKTNTVHIRAEWTIVFTPLATNWEVKGRLWVAYCSYEKVDKNTSCLWVWETYSKNIAIMLFASSWSVSFCTAVTLPPYSPMPRMYYLTFRIWEQSFPL